VSTNWKGFAKAKQVDKYTGRKSTMTETQVRAIRDLVTAGE
jgi:hypothetical protein